VWEQLFESIKDAILANQYRPGEELPIEKLAAEYGVSNTPIREALARLASAGLVQIIPNKGAVVAPITENDLEDVWEVRKLLEPHLAQTAARKCTPEELADLTARLQHVLASPQDFAVYTQTAFDVHALLYKHLSNKLLQEILERVNLHSIRIRHYIEGSGDLRTIRRVTQEHLDIVEALGRGEAGEAGCKILEHLSAGEKRLLHILRATGQEALRAAAGTL